MKNKDNYWIGLCTGLSALSSLIMHFLFFIQDLADKKNSIIIIILAIFPIMALSYIIATLYYKKTQEGQGGRSYE